MSGAVSVSTHPALSPQLLRRVPEGTIVQGSNGPILTCPQCRADVQIPGGGVANFPKNFNLESIVQKVKHHREQREVSQSHVKSEGLEDEYCYQEEPPGILMTITKTILFILQLWRFLRV